MDLPKDDEAFVEFMEESKEHQAKLEQLLLKVESQGASLDDTAINTIFRAAHTIKGSAAFFAIDPVTQLAHAMENLFGLMRSHELAGGSEVVSALLEGSGLLGRMLGDIDHIDEVDPRAIIEKLDRFCAKKMPPGTVPAGPLAAGPPPKDKTAPAGARGREPDAPATIRVKLSQLDRLMMLAGELVLTRNALLKKGSEHDLEAMLNLSQRVDAITSDLQDGVMATRMQPVGVVFNRFGRIVRDLAQSLEKRIGLEIEGEEVELDKTLIEAIGDPLTHLVRNSADHGIESPRQRLEAGKKEQGTLRLRAFHEAGHVVIEISDDGAGIDGDKVAAKAVEKQLMTRQQAEALSDDDRMRLVFLPGLSTANQVTEVSGRGVGMDVVLSSLTKVGGTVGIRSALGRGTTVSIRLPLTLAIIPSILVAVNQERFAIPQVNLVELVRIPAGEIQRRVERVGTAEVMRLRDELLPLVRLTDVLGIEHRYSSPQSEESLKDRRLQGFDRRCLDPEQDPTAADEQRSGAERRHARASAVSVAVLTSGSLRYGVIVDQLLDAEEIVVKPLGSHLAGCREYAGATILGDGTVALILDVAGVCAAARLGATQRLIDAAEARRGAAGLSHDAQTYLVVENAEGEHFGIPLGLVSRIERIKADQVVCLGGRATLTRGTSILPLLAIDQVAKVTPPGPASVLFAVICRISEREVGVRATRIVDIVNGVGPIDDATHLQPGILGSTVVDGRLMLILDVYALVDRLLPEYKKARAAPSGASEGKVVLVVDDSPFFRKQIVSFLSEGGYRSLAAEDGSEGLRLLDQHADRVGLVITDVEMPLMDGLEMTRRIRADLRFASLPVMAVTSLSGEVAERRGRESGLTEYLIKLDRDQILSRATHHLSRKHPPPQGA